VGISLAVAIAFSQHPRGPRSGPPHLLRHAQPLDGLPCGGLSGLAEPLAVIVVGLLFPTNLAPELIEGNACGR